MHLCLTCGRTRMGMNLEICSSAQKSAVALGAMPRPLLQPIVLTQTTASTDTVYYPSCLLIQDLFFS